MASPFIQSIRDHLRARNYSKRTEQTYLYWIVYFIRFHGKRHPAELGAEGIAQFLEFLALQRNVTPSTQKTALNALVYLYKRFLGREEMKIPDFTRASRERKLPVVLSKAEVRRLLEELQGDCLLCAQLMYGSGLRLMEVCRLRVKDIDFDRLSIFVRDGKGRKQRITTLAESCVPPLRRQVELVRVLWEEDREAQQWDGVFLPFALERKYPNAPFELGGQYLFPARLRSLDKRSGKIRRHHIHDHTLQRAVKAAVQNAGIDRPASAIRCAIVLRRTYWSAGPIFVPCRSNWVTRMCAPPRSIRTYSTGVDERLSVRSMSFSQDTIV